MGTSSDEYELKHESRLYSFNCNSSKLYASLVFTNCTDRIMHDSSHPIHPQGSIICAVFQKIGHPCFLKKMFQQRSCTNTAKPYWFKHSMWRILKLLMKDIVLSLKKEATQHWFSYF